MQAQPVTIPTSAVRSPSSRKGTDRAPICRRSFVACSRSAPPSLKTSAVIRSRNSSSIPPGPASACAIASAASSQAGSSASAARKAAFASSARPSRARQRPCPSSAFTSVPGSFAARAAAATSP